MTLCDASVWCSNYVNYWLTKQPEVKEETLTDWFLFTLSEQSPVVKYKQFTRIQEGRETAADWEWWFILSDTRSFACRIQAKKLHKKDNYPGLAYVSRDKLQIERLIGNAEANDFASFYVFYHNDRLASTSLWPDMAGGIHMCEASLLLESFILKPRRPLLSSDVLNIAKPLPYYVCMAGFLMKHAEGEEAMRNIFSEHKSGRQELFSSREVPPKGFRETPSYIRSLLTMESVPESWFDEFPEQFRDTKALFITDLRPNSNDNASED